jgi:lipoprotein-anchoring transpeptidase ErfK/SrfK
MGLLAVGNQWEVATEIAMGADGYQQYENGGAFTVQWTRPDSQLNDGWWTSTLYPDIPEGAKGNMYRPLYFDGAIAVHGSANTDANDASHGCIRTPVYVQDLLMEAYSDARSGGRPMRIVINNGL